jgi:RNA polymerase sigma factor (sigma-70 family)
VTGLEESTYFDLLAREQPRLERIAWAILGRRADVEDALQEAALAGYLHRDQLRDPGAFGGWLRRILVHACGKILRERQAVVTLPEVLPPQGGPPPVADLAAQEVWDAVARLPDHLRPVIVMKYLLDLGQQEIADALGIPLGTVKSRLGAGLARLRATFAAEVVEHGL